MLAPVLSLNRHFCSSRRSFDQKISRDVDAIADYGPLDWNAVKYNHSSEQNQTLDTSEAIQTLDEKKLHATRLEDPRREANKV